MSRASECCISRLEKSTPVSTIAIIVPFPVASYFFLARFELVVSEILDASLIIFSDW